MLKIRVLRSLPRDSDSVGLNRPRYADFKKSVPHGSYGEVKFGKNYLILTAALSTK